MFYKVMKDNKVIDVLNRIIYLKYQPKNKIMVLCEKNEAQAIISSDNNTIWHERSLHKIPVEGYETVDILPIDEYEYKQLKALSMKTPEAIIDEFVLSLLEENIL